MTPRELAERVLPAAQAAHIIGGTLRRQFLPGQVYWASFWERSVPLDDVICHRWIRGVQLANPEGPGQRETPDTRLDVEKNERRMAYGISHAEPATPASCASVKGYVVPQPPVAGETIAALKQLDAAMRAADANGALTFEVTCLAERGDSACAVPRSALAGLPLNSLMYVELLTGHYRTVDSINSAEGTRNVVVRKMVPAPDGKKATPTVAFGPSGRDGRSWRVTLVSANGRLQRVDLRRATIVYD